MSFAGADFLSAKRLQEVALSVAKQYRNRYDDEIESGSSRSDARETATNDRKLLVNRVQNAAVQEIATEIKDQYDGEEYVWLPSDAEEPDPLHQLNYGKVFVIGDGEMPGDRYGCRCGMEILVEESKLEL